MSKYKRKTYECNRDCFNCSYPDCMQDAMSPEDRREISERNKRMDDAINSTSHSVITVHSHSGRKGRRRIS